MTRQPVLGPSVGKWLDECGRMFMELDSDCVVLYANETLKSRFGDPTGRTCHSVIAASNEVCRECPSMAVIRGANGASAKFLRRDLDGNDLVLEVTAAPVSPQDRGRMVAVLMDDVSGHERREEELQKSRDIYRNLVDQVPDMIFSLDSEGCFTFVNSSVSELLGCSKGEVLDTPLWDYVVPEDRTAAKTILDIEPGVVWDEQMHVVDAHGGKKFVRIRCRAADGKEGRPQGFEGVMRDRTATRKLEEELTLSRQTLRESERLYRSVVEKVPDVLFSLDRYGRFTFVNSRIKDFLGFSANDVLDEPFWDYVVPEHRTLAKTLLDLTPEVVWDREMGVLAASGERKFSRIRCRAYTDDQGAIAGFEGVMRDRTAQRKLEEELIASRVSLQDSERRYRDLVERVPDVIFSLDSSGRFTFINSRGEEFLGRPSGEIIGTPFWDCVVPEARKIARTVRDTVVGRVWDNEIGILDSRGNRKHSRIRVNATCDPEGRLLGYEGVLRDRSAQKKMEEDLRAYQESLKESEHRYRNLVEEVPDIIFSLDARGRFTFINTQVEKFLGYKVVDMLDTPLWRHVPAEDRVLSETILQLMPGKIWDEEIGIVDSAGRHKWVRIRCQSPVDHKGRVTGYEGVMRDRTVRKLLEDELRASKEELLAKMKIIDDLYEHIVASGTSKAIAQHTAEVAHELRQPLTIIGGFARRMVRQLECCNKLDPEGQKECFHIIIREVQRLEKILGSLIDFTRHEGIQLELINPNDLIEDVIHLNEELFMEKDINLELKLGDEIREILLDPERFQQVVRNLVSNAIDASFHGGTICLETVIFVPSEKAQIAGGLEADSYFELKIRNGGEIIPAEDIQKIFDPFYSTKDRGTGIGLTISKRIVEGHGGSISVRSDQEGTVFTVWIPMRRGDEELKEAEARLER